MAAFSSRDHAAFDAHWAKNILGNPAAVTQTILFNGQVAASRVQRFRCQFLKS